MRKQEFLELKAILVDRLQFGDVAKAARLIGLKNRQPLQAWIDLDNEVWPGVDGRNYNAVKQVVEQREMALRMAMREQV